jgi:integrase
VLTWCYSILMSKRINNAVADAAEPRASRYVVWDSELAGFGLRVSPTGVRSWIAAYRAGGGRNAQQRLMTLGTYPKVKAPAARDAAGKVLAGAALGHDPAGDRTAKRREMTIADLVDLYEKEGCYVQRGIRQGEPMKATTKAYTMARLRHHVVPLLGTKRVSEVAEGDVERFSRDVARGKTAKDEKVGKRKRIIVRGGDGAARKVVRDLSAVFSFAQRQRIVSANPVATASVRKTDNRRERFLSLDEVKRLGAALEAVEADGANPKAVNQARLWALTGCRRNEIAGLRWEEVDAERGLLILGDTKTGRSVRPLGAAAVALLNSLRAEVEADDVFVFPAERGDGFYQGTKRIWPIVTKKAALEGVTPHVLRHTLGSAAASAGEALGLVGAILGHANARSTQLYSHIAHDPARLAADRATGPLAEALGLKQPEPEPVDPGR